MITSTQNPKVKQIIQLQKAHNKRRKTGLFVVEGEREIKLALAARYVFSSIFCCPALQQGSVAKRFPAAQNYPIEDVSQSVYNKVAVRENSDGWIGIARQKPHELKDLRLSAHPLIVVVEQIEKPGNLGSILRTAAASSIDAVIVCNPQTDIYNPNVIRSSLGSVFINQLALASSSEVIGWLLHHHIQIYCTYLSPDSQPYYLANLTQPCALVLGAESTGLTSLWNSYPRIVIPMSTHIDSLNVSNTAAIVIFEAIRQRKLGLGKKPPK